MSLATELYATGRKQVTTGAVTDLQLAEAYATYAEYFIKLQDRPDLEPPTSSDPATDKLLLALWDTLVEREQQQLDDYLVGEYREYPNLEELYEDTFDGLVDQVQLAIDDPEAETRAIEKVRATITAIGEEMGLTIVTDDDSPDLPPEAEATLTSVNDDDPDAMLRQLTKLRRKYPSNLALSVLHILGLTSPEDTIEHARDWGQPIDPRRVGAIANDELSLATYLFFEEACLSVYAARGERYYLLRSLQRLHDTTGINETAEQRVEYFVSLGIQAQVSKGHVMPDTWEAPHTEAAFPDASQYLLEVWEDLKKSLTDEFQFMFAGSGLGANDLIVPQGYYQIKVTLAGIRPPIWRRLLVPANIQLAELHQVIQTAMGWYNAHLHQFKTAMGYYAPPGSEDYADSYEGLTLNILMQQPKHKIHYEYDFGDSWSHEILLEKVVETDEVGGSGVRCLKGKRACPPEDCGGVGGYYHLLEALKKPEEEDNADLLEWLGGGYDPEAFDIAEVNAELSSASYSRGR